MTAALGDLHGHPVDDRRLLGNVYLSSEVLVDHLLQARAAVLAAQPGAFASLHTAAALWGGVVPHSHLAHVAD